MWSRSKCAQNHLCSDGIEKDALTDSNLKENKTVLKDVELCGECLCREKGEGQKRRQGEYGTEEDMEERRHTHTHTRIENGKNSRNQQFVAKTTGRKMQYEMTSEKRRGGLCKAEKKQGRHTHTGIERHEVVEENHLTTR